MKHFKQFLTEWKSKIGNSSIYTFWADENNNLLLDIKDTEEHLKYFSRKKPQEFKKILEKIGMSSADAFDSSTTVNNEIIKEHDWKRITLMGPAGSWDQANFECNHHTGPGAQKLSITLKNEFPSLQDIVSFSIDDKHGKNPKLWNINEDVDKRPFADAIELDNPLPSVDIDFIDLPDGEYDGLQSGLCVEINDRLYKANKSVRGKNVPVKVVVRAGHGIFSDSMVNPSNANTMFNKSLNVSQ